MTTHTHAELVHGRLLSVLDRLADPDEYRIVYAADGVPCQVDGCVLSQQEHHRLAFGMLTELRELKRQRDQCVNLHGGTE